MIAGILAAILAPQHSLPHWSWPPWASQQNVLLLESRPLAFLLIANISVVLFNMIPAFPMDGGRVLRAILGLLIGKSRATRIAAAVGQFLAILMGTLRRGDHRRATQLRTRDHRAVRLFRRWPGAATRGDTGKLDDLPVSDAMVTRFETLRVGDTLQQAAAHLLATSQQDFPVLRDDDQVAGVLSAPNCWAASPNTARRRSSPAKCRPIR